MAIGVTLLTSGNDPTITTSPKTTASVTVASGAKCVVLVCLPNGSAARTATVTRTTGGATFSKVDSAAASMEGTWDTVSDTLSIHHLDGPFTDTLVITQSNSVQQMHWVVIEVTGLDGTTPFPQSSGVQIGTGTAFSAPLGSPVDATNNRSLLVTSHHNFTGGTTAGSGMTLIKSEPANSPATSFDVSWSNGAWEGSPSWNGNTGATWGALSVELNAAAGGTTVTGLSTVAATAAVNAPTSIDKTAAPSTVSATASVNAPTVKINAQVATVAAVASVGGITIKTAAGPATVAATAAVNAPSITATATFSVSAVAATAAVGTVAIVKSAVPTTVAAVASVNTVTINKTAVVATVAATANVGSVSVVTALKIEDLHEDFTSALNGAVWNDNSGNHVVSGGKLLLDFINGETWIGALGPYVARSSSIYVDLQDVGTGGTTRSATLILWKDGNNNCGFGFINNVLQFRFTDGGSANNSGTVTYDPVQHRWLRISLANNVITFETSPDGSTWSNPFSGATRTAGTWIDGVGVYLDNLCTTTAPGTSTWDNVNVAPTGQTVSVSTVGAVAAVGSIAINITAPVSAVQAVAAVNSPTINKTAVVTTVPAVATVNSPSINKTVPVSTVPAVASVNAPTVVTASTIAVSAVGAVASVNAPTIELRAVVATVQASATVLAPTAKLSAVVAAVAAVASVQAPSLELRTLVATVAAVAAVGAPTVQAGSNQTAAPATVVAVASVGAVTISTARTAAVTAVVATASVNGVTVSLSRTATVLTVTGLAQVNGVTIYASAVVSLSTVNATAAVNAVVVMTSGPSTAFVTTIQAIARINAPIVVLPAVFTLVVATLVKLITAKAGIHKVIQTSVSLTRNPTYVSSGVSKPINVESGVYG